MDLPTNYFITYDINYIYNHKKFTKGIIVFEIALTVAAIGFSISQGNGKGPTLNKPLLLELSSLYLLANDTLKCYLYLLTGYIYANCPLKEASQLYYSCCKASYLKANCPNPIYNNYREASHLKSNCPYIIYNQYSVIGYSK